MKTSRWLMALGAAVALSMAPAASVTAHGNQGHHRPFGGDQVMVLNVDELTGENLYGCEEISWFGTIDLYGRTYGMALYSITGEFGDDGLYHYEEGWRIFTGKFTVKDGELKRCAPGRLLAEGDDAGVWDMSTGEFESEGTVDLARGRLRSWSGQTVKQDGVAPQGVSVAGLEDVPGLIGRLWLEIDVSTGDQVMVLNIDEATGEHLYGCDEISWFGTIDLYGRTHGMALYSISGGVGPDGLYHYEEGWRIFTGTFEVDDGELKRCAPGRLLAAGTDVGVGNLTTGEFESEGTVDLARGRLRSWCGKTVMQDGVAPELVSVAGLENVPGLIGRLWLET